jgi:hypothetical protein
MKAELIVNVGGFNARHFKQERFLSNPSAGLFKRFFSEYVKIGVFFINGGKSWVRNNSSGL